MSVYRKDNDNISNIDVISVTPTITAGAYTTGDQLGSIQAITGATRLRNGKCILESITILDKAKQSAAIDVVFFNSSPSLTSVDTGTFDITDAVLHSNVIGGISITEGYLSFNVNSMVTKSGIALPFSLDSNSRTIYAVAVIRASATYASTTDLQFQYGFLQD